MFSAARLDFVFVRLGVGLSSSHRIGNCNIFSYSKHLPNTVSVGFPFCVGIYFDGSESNSYSNVIANKHTSFDAGRFGYNDGE
jgi:hypothetical protein